MKIAALILLVFAAPAGAQAPCAWLDSPGPLGAADLREQVRTLLEHTDAATRAGAARAIGRTPALPPRSDAEPRTLADKDPRAALIAVLRDPAPAVSIAAACALGRHGDERALPPLQERRAEASADLARAIDWAIDRIRTR